MFINQVFLGASVRSYSSNIGWGYQASQLQVSLVEDPVNGDSFLPDKVGVPQVGQPVFFSHYGTQFAGLLQKWEKKNTAEGLPLYEAVVTDPREVLEGAQVIIGGYSGTTGGVFNLINAFGFWENALGFGGSEATDAGMPWDKISSALLSLANQPLYSDYGGPLTYRGFQYGLDLSEMPNPPAQYRIGGTSLGLLELIAQICEDGGCDFFVQLIGSTIKIKTASRVQSAPLGTISAITNTNWGASVTRASNGLESRNELTSSFLVGGEVTTLNITDNLTQFWGYDITGEPILGSKVYLWFTQYYLDDATGQQKTNAQSWPVPVLSIGQPDNVPIVDDNGKKFGVYVYSRVDEAHNLAYEVMNLNSSPVADILGSVRYYCSTLEMLLAKVDYSTWASYITNQRPDMALIIGLASVYANPDQKVPNVKLRGLDLVNDAPKNAAKTAGAAISGDVFIRGHRMYQFVRGYADEYMGKKFLVGVPFVLYASDPETLKVKASYDVTDGGYLPEGSSPLGLSPLNEDVFKTQDGRFRAFVRYESVGNADLSQVSPQNSVLEGTSLLVGCQVGSQIIYTPSPAVVVTIQGVVTDRAEETVVNLGVIAAIFQVAAKVMGNALGSRFNSVKIAPTHRTPNFAAVPLKSNILTYGPWFAAGASGKVKFEQDPSLNPWNYGGWEQMNLAGNTRVVSALTNMQISETGTIEMAGTPTISIGEILQAGGPNLTNLDVNIGTGGVTTSYRFATFTPKFGLFSKGNNERMKRMSLAAVELRRAIRSKIKENISTGEALGNAERSARAFLELAPAAFKRTSPHDVLVSYTEQVDNGDILTMTQSATYEEAVALSNANSDSAYQATAMMSANGFLRPFCTNPAAAGLLMSSYTAPDTLCPANVPSKNTLDPWKGQNDIEVYAWGNTYAGLHAYRRTGDIANARSLALRGPLVVTGWGYNIRGECVPGSGVDNTSWRQDYLKRQDTWKTGPVDLLWDDRRGVWTCHDLLKGRLQTACPAGGSGGFLVETPQGSGWGMNVWNYFGTAVSGNAKVMVGYFATDNKWYIMAADCPG